MNPPQEAEPAFLINQLDFPPIVTSLGEYLASARIPAYLVGGVIRDVLLGRETADVDLAVAHDTGEVGAELAKRLGGRAIVLDETRGIVRVVILGNKNGPFIDLSPLRDGIREDLSRRDFTLDAMAVSILDVCTPRAEVQLIDPYHGRQDLRSGTIRALSASVFSDDPARLMRAPRLAAELGFTVADETAEWIRGHSHLLAAVAQERIRDELLKLLAAPSTGSSLRLLDGLGLLLLVIPELAEAQGVTQPREHHWDVFDHSIETAGQVERLVVPNSSDVAMSDAQVTPRFDSMDEYFAQEASDGFSRLTLLKLAALLHDIGKPATRTEETSGRIRFLGHQHEGARMTADILSRLRLSRRGIDLVSGMVEHHLRPSQMAQDGELPTARAVYRYYRDVGDAAIDTLYLNLADYMAARGPLLGIQEWSDHCRIIDQILREGLSPKPSEHPPKLIDGHDIMRVFSLAPGPAVGSLMETVHEAQASGEIATKEDAMQLVKASLTPGGVDA